MAKKVIGPKRVFDEVHCPSCKFYEASDLVMYCNKLKMPMRNNVIKQCYHYERAANTNQTN